MFSFPSWQTLPSVSLPQNIQRRFISYFLRTTLGHLVKPGQLDPNQIDAQIGSGIVQVTNVEFNHDVLNEKLRLAQVPFVLESGSLGKVTANLPWPNLLTAPVALSLSSLRLTLVYSPTHGSSIFPGTAVEGISESVSHMAQSFVRDELQPTEASKSAPPSECISYNPPGTFNLNLKENPDTAIVNDDDELANNGVSLIATLIEKLLSRFKFDVSDICINFIFPQTTLILRLDRISYKTDDTTGQVPEAGESEKGEIRLLSFGKIVVSMKMSSPTFETSSPPSPSSDNDAVNMDMTQSIAMLPAASLALDTSIYHSILSTPPKALLHAQDNEEQQLLSLGHGNDSILVTLTTPPLRTFPNSLPLGSHITLDISISPLLISLSPLQVAVLHDLLSSLEKSGVSSPTTSETSNQTMIEDWSIHIKLSSITLSLWNPSTPSTQQHILNDFHSQTSVRRDLPIPHLRILFDSLSAKLSSLSFGTRNHKHHVEGYLEDVSIFYFSYDNNENLLVSAVLVSDLNLHPQYNPNTDTFPIFNITKWMREPASKGKFWRPYLPGSNQAKRPVVRLKIQSSQENTVQIGVPLHIYVDVNTIQFFNSYANHMTNYKAPIRPKVHCYTAQMTSSAYTDKVIESKTNLVVRFSFVRLEASASPFSSSNSRSGIFVLDFHNFQITKEKEIVYSSSALARVLGTLHFDKAIAALTLPHDSQAEAFLAVNSLEEVPKAPSVCFRTISSIRASPSTPSFSVDVDFPFLNILLPRSSLECLMYWLDDFSRSIVSSLDNPPIISDNEHLPKRLPSPDSSTSAYEQSSSRKPELTVKMSISEGKIELVVPRSKESGRLRSLVASLTNTEILAEISPEGKNETVFTLGIQDINMVDKFEHENSIPILHSTQSLNKHSTRPLIKLRYVSIIEDIPTHKSSKIKLSCSGFTFHLSSDAALSQDLQSYFKSPEGVFDAVVPNEHTGINVAIVDGSIEITHQSTLGAAVIYIGELDFETIIVNESPELNLRAHFLSSAVLFVDNKQTLSATQMNILNSDIPYISFWKDQGYALFADVNNGEVQASFTYFPSERTEIRANHVKLKLHVCADTLSAFTAFTDSMTKGSDVEVISKPSPIRIDPLQSEDLLASLDEEAFSRLSGLGPTADLISDDLPTNPDFLDVSYGAAGGLREIDDEDLLDFNNKQTSNIEGVISSFGGETVRMLNDKKIMIIDRFFENITLDTSNTDMSKALKMGIRVDNCDFTVFLYEGYDWLSTRQLIEEEIKLMRRRLLKIKQLLAEGQAPDYSIENTSTLLFNSVAIGLPDDSEDMEPPVLVAAIDRTLQDVDDVSENSWESFAPSPNNLASLTRLNGSRLFRSQKPVIEFCFMGIRADIDNFDPTHDLLSETLVAIRNVEILDHVKTSTWKKFLSQLRVDFLGNVRQTDSDMVRAELRLIRSVPNPKVTSKEGRFRLKILPIKLNVDQDALDFMKKFFSFQRSSNTNEITEPTQGLYFQHVEVFPVDLKLDYKPKRVDYRALRNGKTIELMNFFHFDGSEITLRHITLSGITGWGRLFETLNDLWTPDVKANQLADIISGVSPIRSLVNVGSGVADLVLLPIAQYKKDKRLVRGVQKGTAAFMKNTAMEAVKLGARLATGTQVILEQAETVLGGQGQFRHTVTAEALQFPDENSDERDKAELVSRYADQPQNIHEGFHSAYRSLSRNFHSAAQTILAVPMEVYERSGKEGSAHAIVRAVPIAVLKPMIGTSEAVSKALFGLRNTLDPEAKHENEAKYKHR